MPATGKRGFAEGFMSFSGRGWAVPACPTNVASSPAPERSAPSLLPETK